LCPIVTSVLLPLPLPSSNAKEIVGLRQYATRRKVAGSIPDEVTGFFNCPNHFSRSMALGSTQPLREMYFRVG
jgi:hypothetical protein